MKRSNPLPALLFSILPSALSCSSNPASDVGANSATLTTSQARDFAWLRDSLKTGGSFRAYVEYTERNRAGSRTRTALLYGNKVNGVTIDPISRPCRYRATSSGLASRCTGWPATTQGDAAMAAAVDALFGGFSAANVTPFVDKTFPNVALAGRNRVTLELGAQKLFVGFDDDSKRIYIARKSSLGIERFLIRKIEFGVTLATTAFTPEPPLPPTKLDAPEDAWWRSEEKSYAQE